jgi:hypothetical protein
LVVGWLTPKMSQQLAIDNRYSTNCASKGFKNEQYGIRDDVSNKACIVGKWVYSHGKDYMID